MLSLQAASSCYSATHRQIGLLCTLGGPEVPVILLALLALLVLLALLALLWWCLELLLRSACHLLRVGSCGREAD